MKVVPKNTKVLEEVEARLEEAIAPQGQGSIRGASMLAR